MANKSKGQDEANFAELERIEQKFIIDLEDFSKIQSIISANMNPAYPDPKTNYVMINTEYLDSPTLDFLKYHSFGLPERTKIRIRKYGPDGKWDNKNLFLEIKIKEHEDVTKKRIQLDTDNIKRVESGLDLKFNSELEEINQPLYSHSDLKRFISEYNTIVMKYEISSVLSGQYKRLAYGKGALRVTLDTGLTYKAKRTIPLSLAYKIKKGVDWKELRGYGKRFDPSTQAILEIKHNSKELPEWLNKMLEDYKIESVKFSKYVWCSYNLLRGIVGE